MLTKLGKNVYLVGQDLERIQLIRGSKPQFINHSKPSPQGATGSSRSRVSVDGDVQMGAGVSSQPV